MSGPSASVASFGSWRSPLSARDVAGGGVGFGQTAIDGGDLYWLEARATEAGRNVIVRRDADGTISDVTPPSFNVRNRVHEYGGGAFTAAAGTVYFTNDADQRLYRQQPGCRPEPVTQDDGTRYADLIVNQTGDRLFCVRERHRDGAEPLNDVVAIDLADGRIAVVATGRDFYCRPVPSPDGKRLAWVAWDHPNMPWDGAEIWVAEIDGDGMATAPRCIAGSDRLAAQMPAWAADGTLIFASEDTGWWNLYGWDGEHTRAIHPREAEFGLPHWVFGEHSFAIAGNGDIIGTYAEDGIWRLARIDPDSGRLTAFDLPYAGFSGLSVTGDRALFVGESPIAANAICRLEIAKGNYQEIKRAGDLSRLDGYLSRPRPVTFPTEQGRDAHGFYYPPCNRDFAGPDGEAPPLLVKSHGGPTAAAGRSLDLRTQFWTSRGYAMLDVDYGGSTGYGRAYRERLNGAWGVVDTDDCANGATWLAGQGLADPNRLIIRGSSAGGYTTLCALTFRDEFRAGASLYGIGDLEALVTDTHKFEARYLDSLIGPYPAERDLYRERSPIHHAERLNCPVIFFQGLEDRVVPPAQAEAMVAALREKGVPVAYLAFEGEQHGFRRAETIVRALEAELYFYAKVFGFPLSEEIAPVEIANL